MTVKNLDFSVIDSVVNDDAREFGTKSENNTFPCIELEVPVMRQAKEVILE